MDTGSPAYGMKKLPENTAWTSGSALKIIFFSHTISNVFLGFYTKALMHKKLTETAAWFWLSSWPKKKKQKLLRCFFCKNHKQCKFLGKSLGQWKLGKRKVRINGGFAKYQYLHVRKFYVTRVIFFPSTSLFKWISVAGIVLV